MHIRLAAWQLGILAILYRSNITFVCESYVRAHVCNQYIHKTYSTIVSYDLKVRRDCRGCVAAPTDQ